MSPNTNLPISSPFDASKARQDIVTFETPGESHPPLLEVSPREANAGGTSWPVSFPLTFTVPSRPRGPRPVEGPVPHSMDSIGDARGTQGHSKAIRSHTQSYHPYSRQTKARVNGGPGRPRRLRHATTEPAGFEQDDIAHAKDATSSRTARKSSSVPGNALPATATATGPNRPSLLQRALTAQPRTFGSSFIPDGPSLVSSSLSRPRNFYEIPSVKTNHFPYTSRPLRYEPTLLSGSGRTALHASGSWQTVSPPAQNPHNVNGRPVTLVGPASHGFLGQPPPYRSYCRSASATSRGLAYRYPQMAPVQTPLDYSGMPIIPAFVNTASSAGMLVSANQRQVAIERSTAVAEKSVSDDCDQPLKLILIPLTLPEAMQSNLSRADGPKEALYFNQTKTGLGTLLSDCIHHSHNPDFMFGLGDEELPLSWTRHLLDSPEPDYLYVELTWPGYPRLLHHRVKCQIRDRLDLPAGQTIPKRLLAREIAQGFYTMYQNIQRNEKKLHAGEQVDERYLPQDGRWELGPKWIPVDNIKLVTLHWAYGYTFQAQMAASI